MDYEVTFEPAGDVADAIYAACGAKYRGSSAVRTMQGDGPEAATVKIAPR